MQFMVANYQWHKLGGIIWSLCQRMVDSEVENLELFNLILCSF